MCTSMTTSPNKLESVACELCGADQPELLFMATDRLHGLNGLFKVVRCSSCGLIYLNPRPVNPQAYYPETDYAAHAGSKSQKHFSAALYRSIGLRRRCQAVLARKCRGRLLDIGCGAGDFLYAMNQIAGWQTQGLEISPMAASRARSIYGLDVLVGQLGEVDIPARSFDVVTLWHVLEHLPHPRATLHEVKRILRPDGVIILACPMVDSWEAHFFGIYWAGYDVPRHFYTFSRRTLGRLLNDNGLSCEEIYSVVAGFNSLRISTAFWVNEKFPLLTRAGILHTAMINLVAALLYPVVRLHGPGRGPGVATFYATMS